MGTLQIIPISILFTILALLGSLEVPEDLDSSRVKELHWPCSFQQTRELTDWSWSPEEGDSDFSQQPLD